jgi:nicotinamidase-related amidase
MNKNNTALIVIDPINSCAHEKCETPEWNIYFSKIRQMLPKLENFVKEYRQKIGGLVILTTITPWNKEYLTENINELYSDPSVCYYSEDTTGFDEQFYIVKPEATDLIFIKNTYDAFADGKLTQKLKNKGIKYIIITGIFTDGCVLASIIGGFSQGFNFVILKDLIETTDLPIRQEIQKNLIEYTFPNLYGKTITSTELLHEFSDNL